MTAAPTEAAGRSPIGVPVYVRLLAAAVAAQAFAGSWDLYGLPFPLDRLLLLAAAGAFALHPDARRLRLRLEPLHLLMLATLAWCLGSMIWFGSVTEPRTLFAFVDSFGLLPFALLLVAPVVFGTPARRDVLAAAMTWLGLYVGWVSVAEGLHLYSLVVPGGLVQPGHTHFERALGPSLQVASNGLALLACFAFACVYVATHRGWRRWVGLVSATLCVAGIFFTLTRSIWLAAVIGVLVVVAREPRLRVFTVAGAVAAVLALGVLFAAAPGVLDATTERAETSRSVYDRLNANAAAMRVVAARPVAGVGYRQFHEVEAEWVRQSDDYPITAVGIDVHNVLLGHAAELGIIGAALWLAVLGTAAAAGMAGRPRVSDDPDLHAYRLLAAGFGLAWITVSLLVPISYSLPTTLLWLAIGIVADPSRLGWRQLPQRPVSAPQSPLSREITA